jgi:hypothetical protein
MNLPVALSYVWTTIAARRTGDLKNRRKLPMVVAGKIVDSTQTLQMSTSTGGNHPPLETSIYPGLHHESPTRNPATPRQSLKHRKLSSH